ncbi:hypothetical protein [Collimonas sp.]|uniref:hypothetical protein n=1 Tax=Collimonas sp. TaxID=1963772 RepID=UPI002C3D302E|nr:hypothetical protein [Collimonas sp.]HWW08307.1 hypothetical protein [Collimonas sp.]
MLVSNNVVFLVKKIRLSTSGSQLTQATIQSKAGLNIFLLGKKSRETASNTGAALMRA